MKRAKTSPATISSPEEAGVQGRSPAGTKELRVCSGAAFLRIIKKAARDKGKMFNSSPLSAKTYYAGRQACQEGLWNTGAGTHYRRRGYAAKALLTGEERNGVINKR